jgi:hypothetical protein
MFSILESRGDDNFLNKYLLKKSIFWDIKWCSSVTINRRFGGRNTLPYFQDRSVSQARNQHEATCCLLDSISVLGVVTGFFISTNTTLVVLHLSNLVFFTSTSSLTTSFRTWSWSIFLTLLLLVLITSCVYFYVPSMTAPTCHTFYKRKYFFCNYFYISVPKERIYYSTSSQSLPYFVIYVVVAFACRIEDRP